MQSSRINRAAAFSLTIDGQGSLGAGVKSAAINRALRRFVVRPRIARIDFGVGGFETGRHVVRVAADDAEAAFYDDELAAVAGPGVRIAGHLQQFRVLTNGEALSRIRLALSLCKDGSGDEGSEKHGVHQGFHGGYSGQNGNVGIIAHAAMEDERTTRLDLR